MAAVLLASPVHAAPGDAKRGERVFLRCFACHSVKPEETKLPGPNLFGVVGRRAASLDGFEYSPAMQARGREGLVWTEAVLDRYIAEPEAVVPGTAMVMNGLTRAQDRADVIAYLKASGQGQ